MTSNLVQAIATNSASEVKNAFKNGDNINVTICYNKKDVSLLSYALAERKPYSVLALLNLGAKFDGDDFVTAVNQNYYQIVRKLIDFRQDVNQKIDEKFTVLSMMAEGGSLQDQDEFDRRMNLPVKREPQDENELIENGIFELLVRNGADIYAKYYGMTIFHDTVQENSNPFMMRFLVKKGFDVNEPNEEGQNALWYCSLPRIKYLVKHGANVFNTDDFGRTLLMSPYHVKRLNTFKYFVKQGLSLISSDNAGNNVMHCVELFGNKEVVNYAYKHLTIELKSNKK